jgi:hypothetical protein
MRKALFQPSSEGEARLLLLIDAFSRPDRALQGRTKLAKLDFLLRYPHYLRRALLVRRPGVAPEAEPGSPDLETRMVRYRYGPWDPAYYALLGSLIGRGLVVVVPETRGLGFRTTERGSQLAARLGDDPAWASVAQRCKLLRDNFDLTGNTLKTFIYSHFPEVVGARWGDQL